MSWVATAIGVGVGGTALNLVGANKQRKDQASADAANRASVQESDLNSWKAYLMQRGLNPQGVTAYGQIPTNATAVNTRLPLWANMDFSAQRTNAPLARRRTQRTA